MINYMKSEKYRLIRLKGLHVTSLIACLLIVAAAFVLNYFGKTEVAFPYATSMFFYSNVVNGALFIQMIIIIVNSALTGKDKVLIKQSISFGITRNTIFWSKLLMTFVYFFLLCLIGMLLMIGLGETFFPKDPDALLSFLIACVNMSPIILSGFFLVHVLKMNRFNDIFTIIIVIFVYTMSDTVVNLIFRRIEPLSDLYKWTPSALLNENMMAYAEYTVTLEWKYWIVGIVISLIVLLIGLWNFNKKDID